MLSHTLFGYSHTPISERLLQGYDAKKLYDEILWQVLLFDWFVELKKMQGGVSNYLPAIHRFDLISQQAIIHEIPEKFEQFIKANINNDVIKRRVGLSYIQLLQDNDGNIKQSIEEMQQANIKCEQEIQQLLQAYSTNGSDVVSLGYLKCLYKQSIYYVLAETIMNFIDEMTQLLGQFVKLLNARVDPNEIQFPLLALSTFLLSLDAIVLKRFGSTHLILRTLSDPFIPSINSTAKAVTAIGLPKSTALPITSIIKFTVNLAIYLSLYAMAIGFSFESIIMATSLFLFATLASMLSSTMFDKVTHYFELNKRYPAAYNLSITMVNYSSYLGGVLLFTKVFEKVPTAQRYLSEPHLCKQEKNRCIRVLAKQLNLGPDNLSYDIIKETRKYIASFHPDTPGGDATVYKLKSAARDKLLGFFPTESLTPSPTPSNSPR